MACSELDYRDGGGDGGDPLLALEAVVPGVPGEDYPVYSEVPLSEFSCEEKVTVNS